MKRTILPAMMLILIPGLALAQDNKGSKGHGYVYVAGGASAPEAEPIIQIGGGGEGFFTRYLGAGADLGYVSPYGSFSDGIGTFSPNLVARFRAKDNKNKVEPFVTAGYTMFFREGVVHGANAGGGVNWWFKERVGLRFELRDHFAVMDHQAVHLAGFRIGLAFR